MRRARDVAGDILAEASRAAHPDDRSRLARAAIGAESNARLKAMVELAQSEPGVPAQPEDFDADPWILNTPDGLLDLKTGDIGPHDRAALCSKMTAAAPGQRSELWERCITTWLPDPEVRAFVQRAAGYSMIGSITEALLLILFGTGANGKSVFTETIHRALGDYALNTPSETLIANRSTSIPNDVARLAGARFVSASETGEGRRLAESKIKAMTGGDTITARFMKCEWFSFAPTFTPWLSTNHRPIVTGSDDGIWRRIKLIPFTTTIPEHERDGRLPEKLADELPGVMAWALDGALDYQRVGLAAPEGVTAATADYRRESDTFADFLDERCEIGPGRFASSDRIYSTYREWAQAAGEPVLSRTALGRKLTDLGFDKGKASGRRGWHGLALGGEG